MSSLWTPGGERPVGRPTDPPPPGDGPDRVSEEEVAARLEGMQRELIEAPVEVVVANHCYGLFELAAIYLSQSPPMLFQARLAIDGLSYLLSGLKGRLGEAEPALFESLAQLQLAFVQLEGVERIAAEQSAGSETG